MSYLIKKRNPEGCGQSTEILTFQKSSEMVNHKNTS